MSSRSYPAGEPAGFVFEAYGRPSDGDDTPADGEMSDCISAATLLASAGPPIRVLDNPVALQVWFAVSKCVVCARACVFRSLCVCSCVSFCAPPCVYPSWRTTVVLSTFFFFFSNAGDERYNLIAIDDLFVLMIATKSWRNVRTGDHNTSVPPLPSEHRFFFFVCSFYRCHYFK